MTYTSIVTSKTRVAPIKRLTIPRLELNGALILAQLLYHCKNVLDLPLSSVHAWTDSTIVLAWIQGNPRRFKVYVGNRVAQILELIPADCWRHVVSEDNPADCASRGMFPSELLIHDLWWDGPSWLKSEPSQWPKKNLPSNMSKGRVDFCYLYLGSYGRSSHTSRQIVIFQPIQTNHCLDHQIPPQLQGKSSSCSNPDWSTNCGRAKYSCELLVFHHSKDTLLQGVERSDQRFSKDLHFK